MGKKLNYIISHKTYGENEHQQFLRQEETTQDFSAIDDYIFITNGEYSEYKYSIGTIAITTNGEILYGDIKVKHYGKTYDIDLINMYGKQGMDIVRHGTNAIGWSNEDGMGSLIPKSRTKELDLYIVEKILNLKLEDYDENIQKFMATCREIYNQDKTNYIMDKSS